MGNMSDVERKVVSDLFILIMFIDSQTGSLKNSLAHTKGSLEVHWEFLSFMQFLYWSHWDYVGVKFVECNRNHAPMIWSSSLCVRFLRDWTRMIWLINMQLFSILIRVNKNMSWALMCLISLALQCIPDLQSSW